MFCSVYEEYENEPTITNVARSSSSSEDEIFENQQVEGEDGWVSGGGGVGTRGGINEIVDCGLNGVGHLWRFFGVLFNKIKRKKKQRSRMDVGV